MKEDDRLTVGLDATDRRILQQLQVDASLSNQALAAKVHTSPATCMRRVRRLVDSGVITRQVALLDESLVSEGVTVIAEVILDRQGAEHVEAFESHVIAHSAVQQCYRVSPGPDFVLVLRAHSVVAWSAIANQLFTQQANVRNVRTYFSLHRAKFEPSITLDEPNGS